jgi:LPPG:FO 2-phospho-L-lactate transferase
VIAVLCGGVGAARLLAGLQQVVDPAEIVAVVNTGDDTELYGLHISPDIDTITYTLSGAVNPTTGWGLDADTFRAMQALERFGASTWFRLGDADLATHLYRTARLRDGASLSDVTAEISAAFGLGVVLMPMSDDPVRTRLRLADGEEVAFQEYFVKLRHSVVVTEVRFEGAELARPGPAVLDALEAAEVIVVAPSNPIVSIGPILAVAGISDLLKSRRDSVVAVSPIVAGAALKGPADRLLVELGGEASALGVARHLRAFVGTLVIDEADAGLAAKVREAGLSCVVAPSIMKTPEDAAGLARVVLSAVGSLGKPRPVAPGRASPHGA